MKDSNSMRLRCYHCSILSHLLLISWWDDLSMQDVIAYSTHWLGKAPRRRMHPHRAGRPTRSRCYERLVGPPIPCIRSTNRPTHFQTDYYSQSDVEDAQFRCRPTTSESGMTKTVSIDRVASRSPAPCCGQMDSLFAQQFCLTHLASSIYSFITENCSVVLFTMI